MRSMTLVAMTFVTLSTVTSPHNAIAQSDMIAGQVTRVDEAEGKMTIKHGPIPKFELDEGHTMVFRVQDPAMLKAVKAGDKIK
jgi:Cu(I)/Ag(I) efflux system periplasmic protein CusF